MEPIMSFREGVDNLTVVKAIKSHDFKFAKTLILKDRTLPRLVHSLGQSILVILMSNCLIYPVMEDLDLLDFWKAVLLCSSKEDVNIFHPDHGSLLHWLIKVYSKYPYDYVEKLFMYLIGYTDINIDHMVVQGKHSLKNETLYNQFRDDPKGTPLSYSLEFSNCHKLAQILLKFGAKTYFINWKRVVINKQSEETLKMVIMAGHIPPILFERVMLASSLNQSKTYMKFVQWAIKAASMKKILFARPMPSKRLHSKIRGFAMALQ